MQSRADQSGEDDQCRIDLRHDDDAVRWLALAIRQSLKMLVVAIERHYGLGEYQEGNGRDTRDKIGPGKS